MPKDEARSAVEGILNRHFPPKWKNEGLKERVLEFGADVWDAAIDAAAKVAREHSIPTAVMGLRVDALCPEDCHEKIAGKILALKES